MKEKNYVIIAGYFASGSSAVVDLLREFRGFYECRAEIRTIKDPYGIKQLEQILTERWDVITSTAAITDFIDFCKKCSRTGGGKNLLARSGLNYVTSINPRFMEITNPMIKFIENPAYNETNNISSAMVARYLMQNAYILEADLLVSNPKIIRKYNYQSNVLGIWKERTDDWCLTVDKDNYVIEEKIGGLNCYQMVGIYYFNSADGAKLSEHIKEAFLAPGGKERYWETVPNQVYKGQYKIEVRPCKDEDIVEIDTFRELKQIDKTYDV